MMSVVIAKERVEEMKKNRKVLKTLEYTPTLVNKGYTDKTLYINLSENQVEFRDIPEMVKEKFIGGKGYGLWHLWNGVNADTKWNDPENEIVISPGPIAGITQYPGAGKSLVVSISPITNTVIDSNVGGHFGPLMKFSGFDALEIQGKAENDVVVFIDGNKGRISIEEAPVETVDSHILAEELTEMYADDEEDKRHISVVSSGQAAEHSFIGLLNFSFYDKRKKAQRLKQAGRGGIGTVFRDKKIKALIVKYKGVKGDSNHPADVQKIKEVGMKLHKEVHDFDDEQCQMRQVGTANLFETMSDYDLLPVNNFQYGSHKDAAKTGGRIALKQVLTQNEPDGCWFGCSMSCATSVTEYELQTGPYKGQKVVVDGPEYETIAGVGSNCGIFDIDYVLECNFYCDTYGVDTISFGTLTAFAMECYERGVIDKEVTGGLEMVFGNKDAAMELLHQMARGEGFGLVAGKGVRAMRELFVKEYGADENLLLDIGMESKGLEYSQYVSKESLAQQGGYALTNKGPQHDEAWLIFMDMVNNQIPTFDDKAEALHYFPMFRTWFGLQGLCKLPWNDVEPISNRDVEGPEAAKVPEHVQNYVDLYNAVTGNNIDKQEMILQSERVYNFQKVFNIRLGVVGIEGDRAPYRSMGPVTKEEFLSREERYDKQMKENIGIDPEGKTLEEKMKITRDFRESQFAQLRDTVYKRRGWTVGGIPTVEHLQNIGMDLPEVLEVVKPYLK